MPLARGIRVLVVHIFCSPGALASQPLRKKANHRDEAEDAESQEGYHDDGRPPHVDHLNLTIYLTFPEQEAAHRVVDHTWSNEVACRPLTPPRQGRLRRRTRLPILCQATRRRLTGKDNSGMAAQRTSRNEQSWTICPPRTWPAHDGRVPPRYPRTAINSQRSLPAATGDHKLARVFNAREHARNA
jgi:hypothetical protein